MSKIKISHFVYYISFSLLVLLSSCNHYERQSNCHLDKMNVNGDVTKIETIVVSSMPLTELYYGSFDPSTSISMASGNFVYEIDNHGNVRNHIGYGINGEKLFETAVFVKDTANSISPGLLGATNQKITRIETVKSSNNRIVNTKYYSNSDLIWNQRVFYNDRGDVERIIKNYSSLEIKVGSISLTYADTTTLKYASFDEHGNWTKLLVDYKGILPKHNHQYTVLRQLTYLGQSSLPPLMNRYKELNAKKESHVRPNLVSKEIGQYGRISIPNYMALQSDDYISSVNSSIQGYPKLDYYFMSVYDKKDAYATFSISRIFTDDNSGFKDFSPEELQYSKELDEYLEKIHTEQMASQGTYVLKWLPYRIVTLSGKQCMKISYYRYGNGSPIPVYCENYTIPMGDYYTLNIIFSFQSNLDERFRSDFENAIQSIELY